MRRFTSAAFVLALLVGTAGAFTFKPINARCPVKTDQPVKDGLSSDFKGFEIGFCCNNCKGAWGKNPEPFIKNVPELKAALAKMEKDAEKAKSMTGPCDCKKTVKGYYCLECKRELGADDVRGNVCKRCENKPANIEYCLKISAPYLHTGEKTARSDEDKARVTYECETCGVKGEVEAEVKHKPDCKPAFGNGLKKVCSKSGTAPHQTEK